MLSFAFMGWAFYEASGGADFQPGSHKVVVEDTVARADFNTTTPVIAPLVTPAVLTTPAEPKPVVAVTMTSVPTTQRLIGTAAPTPEASLIRLGPEITEPTTEILTEEATPLTVPEADVRFVSGNRVNMRNGPGTSYSVVATLPRDTEVEVLQDPGQGWVKLQVADTGHIGWMSARLLSAPFN